MKIGPIIGILWIAIVIASFVALLIAIRRHGAKGARWALLGPLGAIASAALVVAWIGSMEGVYRNPPARAIVALVLLLATGTAGLYVQVLAWRAALRPPIGPGCCQKCGYELKDLRRCPECGTERSATTKEDGHSAGDGPATPSPQTPLESHAPKQDATR